MGDVMSLATQILSPNNQLHRHLIPYANPFRSSHARLKRQEITPRFAIWENGHAPRRPANRGGDFDRTEAFDEMFGEGFYIG